MTLHCKAILLLGEGAEILNEEKRSFGGDDTFFVPLLRRPQLTDTVTSRPRVNPDGGRPLSYQNCVASSRRGIHDFEAEMLTGISQDANPHHLISRGKVICSSALPLIFF